MLRRGSSGPDVEELQRRLLAQGINPGPVDGLFGTRTEAAVRRFQESAGLEVDGVAGPHTTEALAAGSPSAEAANDEDGHPTPM
jgi:peptidoglycan hydrolase-like protein with peptidoglycan-binding domain